MGLIITPSTGGITYPNISDVANSVTINPSVETIIRSDRIYLQSNSNDVILQSSGAGITIDASGTIACTGVKFGVFGNNCIQQTAPTTPAGGLIEDTEARTAINQINAILLAYGLTI